MSKENDSILIESATIVYLVKGGTITRLPQGAMSEQPNLYEGGVEDAET